MKIPGIHLVKKAERTGNAVPVPMTRRRLGIVELLKRTFKEVGDDHLAAFAGNLTYKALFALFPFALFMLSLLGLFGTPETLGNMLDQSRGVLPGSVIDFLDKQVLSLASSQADTTFTWGAIISILFALWGVSGAFRSVMEALNVVYEVDENRPAWKVYLISLLLSLGVAALLISSLVLIVVGPQIGKAVADVVGLGAVFEVVWNVVRFPVLLGVVLFAFSLVYYFAPNVEQRFKWVSPGSIAAVVLWLLFSLVFSLYVNNIGSDSYSATYGSLASVAVLMLYIYYSSLIVLVGGEMNQVIEEHIPEGKNEGEKTTNEDAAT